MLIPATIQVTFDFDRLTEEQLEIASLAVMDLVEKYERLFGDEAEALQDRLSKQFGHASATISRETSVSTIEAASEATELT